MKTFLAIMAFAMAFHVAARLAAHDAPSGWAYDPSCCNTMDCRPVDGPTDKLGHHSVQVLEVDGGYRISTTGEFISWKSKMIRESKDGEFHLCSRNMGDDNASTICLYVPNRGY